MRSLLFVFLIACGGGGSKPTAVSNQPPPPPPTHTTGESKLAGPTQPTCPDAGDVTCAIDTMQYFSDRICTCKDKSCGDGVNNDMTAWGTDMAKRAGDTKPTKPTDAQVKRMTEIMTKYTECMTKLMMDNPPPADPCAGSPDPCGG